MTKDDYKAYLMRLWRVEGNGVVWRVRLEDVQTGEVLGFASLEKLMAFLESLGGEGEQPGGEQGEGNDT